MAIDPNIARGVTPIGAGIGETLNAFAQQALQRRAADNQNALFQYQLDSARRTDSNQNALQDLYARNPDASLQDAVRAAGPVAGSEAFTKMGAASTVGQQYQLMKQANQLRQVKYWADQVALDPSKHDEAAQHMAALGIQGQPATGMAPDQIQAQAKNASQSLQQQLDALDTQLVDPKARFEAGNAQKIEQMKADSSMAVSQNNQAGNDRRNAANIKKDYGINSLNAQRDLKPVQNPDGTVTYATAAEAKGKPVGSPAMAAASSVSDQALSFAADTYRTTGKFPAAFGRNPAMQAKVLNKVAADADAVGDTPGAIAARSGALKANGIALDQNTKLLTSTQGYLSTLDKNLDALSELQGKVDSSGSPLINKVIRAWQQGVSGDPDVAKYVTFLSSAQGEFAKLKSGSLGNTPASDAAQADAKEVINKYMNSGTIASVKEAMHQEGVNRVQSIQEQTDSLRSQMGANAPSTKPTGAPSATTPAAPTAAPKTLTYDPATGTFK